MVWDLISRASFPEKQGLIDAEEKSEVVDKEDLNGRMGKMLKTFA